MFDSRMKNKLFNSIIRICAFKQIADKTYLLLALCDTPVTRLKHIFDESNRLPEQNYYQCGTLCC